MLADMQPDALAAAADKLDGTLNNQSLVVLFTCNGKKLLFVGDAQWGNWAYWLYGRAVTGSDPGISDRAKEILGSIDFYKVGHHGSTNATPIPAVGALNHGCACMCSTATGAYGSIRPRRPKCHGPHLWMLWKPGAAIGWFAATGSLPKKKRPIPTLERNCRSYPRCSALPVSFILTIICRASKDGKHRQVCLRWQSGDWCSRLTSRPASKP